MIQQTTIRLPVELYKRLKEGANKRGLTLNAYIISILWEAIDLKNKNVMKNFSDIFSSEQGCN